MKWLIRGNRVALRLPQIIISLVVLTHSMKASATDILDILRLTAEHPALYSAQNSADAALFDVSAAEAASNIQLGAGINATGYTGQPGVENNPLAPYVNVSKVLYDHGRTAAIVDGKQAEYQMQLAQINVTREALNQQVLSLYGTALTNAKVVSVLDQEILALGDLLQRVKTIATIDSGRASEVNQVGTRLSAVVASREASDTVRQQAWQQLVLLVDKPVTLTQELADLKTLGLLPPSLDRAEQSLKDHPELQVASHKRTASLAALDLASKWNRPTWNVQLTLNSPRNHGEMAPLKAAMLQVSSDLSLWDGGKGSATLKGEAQRLASTEQDKEATARQLKQQLVQQWIALPLREKQLTALEQQASSAWQTWKAGETQFFAGQRPLTDLISFVTDYYSGLASFEEQRVQYQISQWQIIASLGKLSGLAKSVASLPSNKITVPGVPMAQTYLSSDTKNKPVYADDKTINAFRTSVDKNKKIITEPKTTTQMAETKAGKNDLRGWPW